MSVANHSVAIALSLIFLAPFVFVLLTALMTREQALSTRLWPHPFRWSNFADVFRAGPFVRYAWNTTVVACWSSGARPS